MSGSLPPCSGQGHSLTLAATPAGLTLKPGSQKSGHDFVASEFNRSGLTPALRATPLREGSFGVHESPDSCSCAGLAVIEKRSARLEVGTRAKMRVPTEARFAQGSEKPAGFRRASQMRATSITRSVASMR